MTSGVTISETTHQINTLNGQKPEQIVSKTEERERDSGNHEQETIFSLSHSERHQNPEGANAVENVEGRDLAHCSKHPLHNCAGELAGGLSKDKQQGNEPRSHSRYIIRTGSGMCVPETSACSQSLQIIHNSHGRGAT